MENDEQFWRALRDQTLDTRRRAEEPSPEEVLAFVEGRLEGTERERVAEAIAAFPAAARLARDLTRFPEAGSDEVRSPEGSADATAIWRKIRSKLDSAEHIAEPSIHRGTGATGLPSVRPPAARRRTGIPWWAAAAAALLGIFVGFAGQRLATRHLPEPNPEVRTLMPRGQSLSRGAGAQPVAGRSGRLVLELAFAEAIDAESYTLLLKDSADRILWSTADLRRHEDDTFSVTIPSGFLGPGSYILELRRPLDLRSPPLAVYDLVVHSSGER